ncbi:MAG: FGGY-family carbohydrate kinase [Candidatus Korarchaeota archaeon]
MDDLLLGLDLGTTTAKATIYDVNGNFISGEVVEYPIYTPRAGWAEQEATEWWEAIAKATKIATSKIDPRQIKGISVSGQREGVALVDREGNPLSRVIIWMDRRSVPQAEKLKQTFSEREIYNITGLKIDSTFTAPKLLWIKENQPELLQKTYKLLQPKDFIVFKLTGRMITDKSVASRTLLFDIHKRQWSAKLFDEFGIDMTLFPESLDSWEIAGEVTKDAAEKTGLVPGIPVLAGGGDRPIESFGTGLTSSDSVCESTGTGLSITVALDKIIESEKMLFSIGVHVLPGKWALEGGMGVVGSVLRWYRDNFGHSEKELGEYMGIRSYELMDMAVERIPPGSDGLIVIPMFMGARVPRWNPAVRGVIFGLTLSHTRMHIARAIMEGAVYELRFLLETLEKIGLSFKEVRHSGGGSKTPLWNEIKANILKKRAVVMQERDAGGLGNAMLAGYGTKVFSSPEEAARTMTKVEAVIEPDPNIVQIYEAYYQFYLELVERLMDLYQKHSQLPRPCAKEVKWTQDKLIHLLYKLDK